MVFCANTLIDMIRQFDLINLARLTREENFKKIIFEKGKKLIVARFFNFVIYLTLVKVGILALAESRL